MDELEYYRKLERAGHISIIETRSQLEEHLESDSKKVDFVLLMEGADPIRSPTEVGEWFQAGNQDRRALRGEKRGMPMVQANRDL